ncbi:hypothetical protein [Streptomyces sp. NPDC056304]|uniref:hypothetical protein n=1 Tax=Streptomyces sp. NPDC056304 TaxID=3345778 RepID=UPI0035DE09F1
MEPLTAYSGAEDSGDSARLIVEVRPVEPPGDLGVGEPVGETSAVLLGHVPPACRQYCLCLHSLQRIIAFDRNSLHQFTSICLRKRIPDD